MNLSILFLFIFILNFVSVELKRRIAGGNEVRNETRRAYMAYLIREELYEEDGETGTDRFLCTGTIISTWHILTAAHCAANCYCKSVDDSLCDKCTYHKPESYSVYTGRKVLSYDAPKSSVKKFHFHPDNRFNDLHHQCEFSHDIAIAELTEELVLGPTRAIVSLPMPVLRKDVNGTKVPTTRYGRIEKFCFNLGWGDKTFNDPEPYEGRVLKGVRITSISTEKCLLYMSDYEQTLSPEDRSEYAYFGFCVDTHICAMDPLRNGHIGCSGDSGGPLMCGRQQVGVYSKATAHADCTGKFPDIYTRLDVNMNWIYRVLLYHKFRNELLPTTEQTYPYPWSK